MRFFKLMAFAVLIPLFLCSSFAIAPKKPRKDNVKSVSDITYTIYGCLEWKQPGVLKCVSSPGDVCVILNFTTLRFALSCVRFDVEGTEFPFSNYLIEEVEDGTLLYWSE